MHRQLKTQVTDLLDQSGGENLQIEFFDYVDQSNAFSAANLGENKHLDGKQKASTVQFINNI